MASDVRASALSTEFAALHLRFADRAAAVTGVGVVAALGAWTPAARLSGAAWPAVAGSPSPAMLAQAYRAAAGREAGPAAGAGCFSCAVEDDRRTLRLHFTNREGNGVLAADRFPVRRHELATTLRIACARWPGADRLRGGSWLYHLSSYRSLFRQKCGKRPGLSRSRTS